MLRKSLNMALILIVIAGFSLPSAAQDIIRQTETHSVFKGLFLSLWSRLRELNPHQRQSARAEVVYTAGIRGAESTETLIQPYWKDDLSQDKAFQQELKQFSVAQQLMDKGELNASVDAFDSFISEYPNSNLLPNAQIAKGVSLAGLGKNTQAVSTLSQFIDANPAHPLSADANALLSQLR
jgi:TolA-binding protein